MSDTAVLNRIEKMRARYLSELAESENRSKAIKAKLQVLEEISSDELQIGETIPEKGIKRKVEGDSNQQLPKSLTAACEWILAHADGKALSTGDVRRQLLSLGHTPKGKNFSAIVMNTLKRLAGSDRALAEKRGNSWFFRPKSNTDETLL
jgi:hypothetical protein